MNKLAASVVATVWLVQVGVSECVLAHCDALDGPVVNEARVALEKRDVVPVLKWVGAEHEAEVRAVFQKSLVVREKGPEARELADRYFFETLVRLHRATEGAPYTGLKPAGVELTPPVAAADKALDEGTVAALSERVARQVRDGIRRRFARALEAKKRADESVEAGREFVKAYVEFVLYMESLHAAIEGGGDRTEQHDTGHEH